MTPVQTVAGNIPLVLALPHTGTHVPAEIFDRLNPRGQGLDDTDWHIDRLYDQLIPGVSTVRATFHRYVIDANRDPAGHSLYPGQNTTGLCPVTDFDGQSIYRAGQEPDSAEIADRAARFNAPYHAALVAELARLKALHGVVILYDCHSIRADIPFLFDGTLPDFNIGTNGGTTCAPAIQKAVNEICERAAGYSSVLNGRFKGGWTTRHYGQPASGVHAIQMELAQSTYMQQSAPWSWQAIPAKNTRTHLKTILESLNTLAKSGNLN